MRFEQLNQFFYRPCRGTPHSIFIQRFTTYVRKVISRFFFFTTENSRNARASENRAVSVRRGFAREWMKGATHRGEKKRKKKRMSSCRALSLPGRARIAVSPSLLFIRVGRLEKRAILSLGKLNPVIRRLCSWRRAEGQPVRGWGWVGVGSFGRTRGKEKTRRGISPGVGELGRG